MDKHLALISQAPGFYTGLFGNKYYGDVESMNKYNNCSMSSNSGDDNNNNDNTTTTNDIIHQGVDSHSCWHFHSIKCVLFTLEILGWSK